MACSQNPRVATIVADLVSGAIAPCLELQVVRLVSAAVELLFVVVKA